MSAAPLVAVVGGGPAGLMAAEQLAVAGHRVTVFDAMPSVGRKFLLAGKGGLNLTHAEPFERFVPRYAGRTVQLAPLLHDFGAEQLRSWSAALGVGTFVGSSGRVFPSDMKAAPLLRAWLHRLRGQGVSLQMRHRWLGFGSDGELQFATPHGLISATPAATVLALGGASWPQLGSTGGWVEALRARGVDVGPLLPSNCGFDAAFSARFTERHAGQPLKGVALTFGTWRRAGEFVVTAGGVEGSLIYAASARLRDAIAAHGPVVVHLDLLPATTTDRIAAALATQRDGRTLSTHLKRQLRLDGVKAGLLWECVPREAQTDPARLAAAIKAVPVQLLAPRPVQEAISSAGGVRFEALDGGQMLRALPGVFCAGEMLDWEAPTGGYLLTACFATGRAAGLGAAAWLAGRR